MALKAAHRVKEFAQEQNARYEDAGSWGIRDGDIVGMMGNGSIKTSVGTYFAIRVPPEGKRTARQDADYKGADEDYVVNIPIPLALIVATNYSY